MLRSTAAVRLLAGDKEPVRLASTANLALAGLLTVDGVLTVAGDRILAKDQTDATENGIYTASEGTWYRAPDFASSRSMIAATKVAVQEGAAHAGDVWSLDTNRPNLGDDDIEFSLYLNTAIADEINAARETLVAEMDAIIAAAMGAGKATQAEAEAGVSNVGWMTPLRVFQAIAAWVSTWVTTTNLLRVRLTADRIYYVRKDGSNSNTGLSDTAGGALLTIQKAVTAVNGLDLSGYNVTIQVRDGTYVENIQLLPYIGRGSQGHTMPVIQGNSATPENVLVQPASGNAFIGVETGGFEWVIKDLKVAATGATCIQADAGSWICVNNVVFGAATLHMQAIFGGIIEVVGNYTISDAAYNHIQSSIGSKIFFSAGHTVTLIGTPAFTAFVQADRGAYAGAIGATFSGSATGQRYLALSGGIIDSNTGNVNHFPGNSAGVSTTGYFL